MSDVSPLESTEDVVSWRRPAAIGVIALSLCIVCGLSDPVHFFRAYLPAWLFYLGLALGSMAILMVYHLIGGAWGYLLRRIVEAGMRTLPLVAVLFVPIALGSKYLYPWVQPDLVASSSKLQHQTFYLTRPYFLARAGGYFAAWMGLAYWLSLWSQRLDRTSDSRLMWKCEQMSACGAVIYGITLHFAAIDWAMSLLPAFHSTIWGPLFALGQLLSALSLAVIVFAVYAKREPLASAVSSKAVSDMGSLLLTFLITWAYMAWFQFMLIWIANLRVDIIYYLPRRSAYWQGMTWSIVILHFAIPFFLLLMRPLKRNAVMLAGIAGLLLVSQLAYMYYQITPMFPVDGTSADSATRAGQALFESPSSDLPGTLRSHGMFFLMPIALGGIWLAYYFWQLGRWPLLPAGDEQRAQALYLRRLDAEETAREETLAHE